MAEEYRKNSLLKEELLHKTANWINEQIEHVWCALAGGESPKKEDRNLQIKQKEKETFYYFRYKDKIAAEAKSYFAQEDCQWRFELIQVSEEYYQKIHDYFTNRN